MVLMISLASVHWVEVLSLMLLVEFMYLWLAHDTIFFSEFRDLTLNWKIFTALSSSTVFLTQGFVVLSGKNWFGWWCLPMMNSIPGKGNTATSPAMHSSTLWYRQCQQVLAGLARDLSFSHCVGVEYLGHEGGNGVKVSVRLVMELKYPWGW